MNRKQYVKEIIQRSCLPKSERKRLKNDLDNEIAIALERGESMEEIIQRMGEPDNIAAELYENYANITIRPFREYKSKKTLFGLPLVHIIRANYTSGVSSLRGASIRLGNVGGRYANASIGLPTAHGIFAFGPRAKGVFAVGNLSSGFIAIGNLSIGIISIGNLSAGLFSIGNLALALLMTLGNVAAGLLAVGNMAVGYATAGNYVVGKYAIGNDTFGTYTFSISNLSTQLEQIKVFFSEMNPSAPIKAFYNLIENALEAIANPATMIPIIVISSIVLAIFIASMCIIPKMILDKKYQ